MGRTTGGNRTDDNVISGCSTNDSSAITADHVATDIKGKVCCVVYVDILHYTQR